MTAKFRSVALVEAISYLLLLCGVFVKRVIEGPDIVPVLGPIHGIAFLAYLLVTLLVREEQGWTPWQTVVVLAASAVPFGGFIVNQRMVRDPDTAAAR